MLSRELTVFSARATSAAPTWFAEFEHTPSKRSFLDGGLYYNNPVKIAHREARLIWPHRRIDVVLSVGSGANVDPEPEQSSEEDSTWWKIWTKVPGRDIWRLGKIAVDHLANSLDSERTWKQYLDERNPGARHRFVRLNTALPDPVPELHEVSKIDSLLEQTINYWERSEQKQQIANIAHRLVASCFYLTLLGSREEKSDLFTVSCKSCSYRLQFYRNATDRV